MHEQARDDRGFLTRLTSVPLPRPPLPLEVQKRWLRRLFILTVVLLIAASVVQQPIAGSIWIPSAFLFSLWVILYVVAILFQGAVYEQTYGNLGPRYLDFALVAIAASVVASLLFVFSEYQDHDRERMAEARLSLYFQTLTPTEQQAFLSITIGGVCSLREEARCAQALAPYLARARAEIAERRALAGQ